MLLSRLPRLRDPQVSPEQAFGGTFHINETYSQLDCVYAAASSGHIPDPLSIEIYCHSLADPSILSPGCVNRVRRLSPSFRCRPRTGWCLRVTMMPTAPHCSGRS